MSDPVPFGTVEPFITRFTLLNIPVTDATGVIFIYRLSTNEYWNGATWQGVRISNVMTEISETNQTGDWRYNFDTSVGDASDEYIVEMVDTSGNSDNLIARLSLKVGGYIDAIIDSLLRILGLSKENSITDATEVSENGVMTEGDVYNYDKAIQATNDGRVQGPADDEGLISQYHIVNLLTVEGKPDKFTMTRVL